MKEYKVVLDDQVAGALFRVMSERGWPTFASAVAHILILWLADKKYL